MTTSTDLDRLVGDRLGAHNLRYTSCRRAIVATLRDAGGPVTLPELLDAASNLAQSSAYRNLSQLEEAGVVRRLVHGTDDHARYELAESLTEHHHHLICESCGAVRDVTFGADTERSLAQAFERVAGAAGFAVQDHVIDVYGTCTDCTA